MGYDTNRVRNVALLGHSGSGKTTMAEAMLFEARSISRRGDVESKNTISDYTNIEKERGNSIFSSLMNAKWKDSKINILDTPGSDDFVGEIISTLKVADTAVMLINATNGVEVGSELIWDYIQEYQTPAIFVFNQMDHEKSNYEQSLEQTIERFGNKVLPIQYPLNEGNGFNTIVDALRMTMYVFSEDGGKPEKVDIPESEIEKAQNMHNALVEAAAENDESLMESFFENGTLNEDELAAGLRIGLANQQFYPVFCCSSKFNMGTGRVMGFINDVAPSPADRPEAPLEDGSSCLCNTENDPVLFIYKTISEPNVGAVTYFKMYSGVVKNGDELQNLVNSTSERINQLYSANGKNREPVDEIRAGDLGVILKLKDSHTNQTLGKKGSKRVMKRMTFPEPRIRTAIKPPSKGDLEKLAKVFHIMHEEDPTLIIEQSPELRQTILHGQGQLHLDILKYRIEKVYNLKMDFYEPRIPYRETITKEANDSYRHKKQSGGSGQFAEVYMRVEPYTEGMPEPHDLNVRKTQLEELPWGGHLSFYWCIVGGSIDTKFINAIKKGVMQKMQEGPLTGSACRDVRVCIYDGKMHPVDSNDMAFQIAATYVFKSAFEQAAPKIMEPIYEVEILCAEDVMGDIMGDLQGRRAVIQGMDSEGHYQKIIARVPLAELHKYSSTLRSLSQGRAKFTQKFVEYAQVPFEVQDQLTKAHKKELAEA